jgi:polar amino acid transport system substrate-binding protein
LILFGLFAAVTLRWGGDSSGGGPYIYEGENGKLVGFEVDLASYLGAKLGRESQFVYGDWGRLPYLLDRGTIDIVLNGYEWSKEREEKWTSTIPYYVYALQLLVRASDDRIGSAGDLVRRPGAPKLRVGVLSGSAAER